MACEIHVGNITQFKITVATCDETPINLSTATTMDFLLQKPDGSLLIRAGGFYTDGTDGIVVYTTTTSDLDQQGSWRYQLHLIYDSNEQYTNIVKFKVFANLPLR